MRGAVVHNVWPTPKTESRHKGYGSRSRWLKRWLKRCLVPWVTEKSIRPTAKANVQDGIIESRVRILGGKHAEAIHPSSPFGEPRPTATVTPSPESSWHRQARGSLSGRTQSLRKESREEATPVHIEDAKVYASIQRL